ncbi:poly(glycerol-phosphate) alpha-glucosyltransferase [Paenibacillus forsythiae]|uniref:Poly(Glycerol-phosphate) alpha-glucosyltransferase n=1 Tax=Paenibacillus forsythiae TaxID=365616 RepID=A0ABU3H6I4_9BACL|nr:glycosyltransferase [Paenibacillus forsythiae]MDT3426061.1 poly(glycerol-phosphate) alpha-glucosyltransferase [Paenibacillus forsythiae]
MTGNIYSIKDNITVKAAGLTIAMLQKAKMLSAEGRHIEMLTLDANLNYDSIFEELAYNKSLDSKVIFRNVYVDLGGDRITHNDTRRQIDHPVDERGFTTKQADAATYRLYKDGFYAMYKRYDENDKLLYVDYFNELRYRTKRENYDRKGYLRRSQIIDPSTNNPRVEVFYNKSGEPFLNKWIDLETNSTRHIIVFGRNGEVIKELKNEYELHKYWLSDVVLKNQVNPIVLSEKRSEDQLILDLKHKSMKKVAVFHNNHFKEPFDFGAEIQDRKKLLVDSMDKFDAVVFLTNEQKKDITAQFGVKSNYWVIPHSAPIIEPQEVEKDWHTIVSLQRLVPHKNVDHVIKAFEKVIKQVPKAKLQIWGFGPEEGKLKSLAKKLGVESSVSFNGFTTNAIGVFQSAALSVMTSSFEGFGMIVTESMACGTPVVSYRSKYGPEDIISNNVDGVLIAKYDIAALSKAIIDLLKDRDKLEEMSQQAKKISQKFSYDSYKKSWLELFDSLS